MKIDVPGLGLDGEWESGGAGLLFACGLALGVAVGALYGVWTVPFEPRNDRPVYCSTCFDRMRAAR